METEGVNVSEPEMLVKALAAADRVMEAKGPLPTELLNTKPPEMTGPSRDTVWAASVCPEALKMTLLEAPGRPWIGAVPAESEVKLLPLALKPNQFEFTPPFQ